MPIMEWGLTARCEQCTRVVSASTHVTCCWLGINGFHLDFLLSNIGDRMTAICIERVDLEGPGWGVHEIAFVLCPQHHREGTI